MIRTNKYFKECIVKIFINGYDNLELKNYSASIPDNEDTVKMTSELAEIVKGLNIRYHEKEPVSVSYCTLKFGTIEKNAVNIQNVIGAKPR